MDKKGSNRREFLLKTATAGAFLTMPGSMPVPWPATDLSRASPAPGMMPLIKHFIWPPGWAKTFPASFLRLPALERQA